jgi:hypothetical protein
MAKKFPVHPFIEKLTKGNNSAVTLRALRGFIGQGPTEDIVRIYLDLSMDRYIDVPEQYVHHVKNQNKAETEREPSEIWLDAKTPLTLDDLYRIVLQGVWIGPVENPIKPKPTVVNPIMEKVNLDIHADRSSSYSTIGADKRGGTIELDLDKDKKPKPPNPKPKRGRS